MGRDVFVINWLSRPSVVIDAEFLFALPADVICTLETLFGVVLHADAGLRRGDRQLGTAVRAVEAHTAWRGRHAVSN